MIAHVRGVLLAKSSGGAVVECAGVGYELAVSIETAAALPEAGGEARLHVHTHVREDQIALFGFATVREKRVFERLLGISGIGPKLALTILSGVSADRLVGAIRGGDVGMLVKIPGVGKKTAERVVLELKDKLDDVAEGMGSAAAAPVPAGRLGPLGEDVVSALLNLGYPRAAAQGAVEAAMEREGGAGSGFEALFRAAMDGMR